MAIDEEPEAGRPGDPDPRWRPTPTKIVATVILLVAIVVPLLSWTYARATPRLFGFPFFYWYQLLWVFLAAGACYLAYALLRREAHDFRSRQHTTLTPPTGPPPGDAAGDRLAEDPAADVRDDERKAD